LAHSEERLRQAQKMEAIGQLAGGIAHDFNNLLVSILGNASLAKTLPHCTPELTQVFDDIEVGARRAAELTKQMLDYAGQGKVRIQNIHVPSMVREMTKLLHALIPKHVELRHHFQEGLPSIEADPTQIRQVIMNLVTNAAEAMSDRPGRVVVSIEQRYVARDELERYLGDAATPGTFVCLEVEDAGGGMAVETVERVFDPFFTTKFMGRGLGMAAVLGIVRSHQGAIRMESREGEGTKVVVLLPTKGGERAAAPRASEKSLGTVLVVDDDEGVRMVAKRSLLAHGYDVLVAPDGAAALRMLEQYGGTVALVLMDVTMPGMSGFEAVALIRKSGNRVPIVLSSGYEVDPSQMETHDVSGVLEKPYDVRALLAAVEQALGRP
ncbi:MAG TPA: ATP-binding protein, partial [Polyangiaceae bacterium]